LILKIILNEIRLFKQNYFSYEKVFFAFYGTIAFCSCSGSNANSSIARDKSPPDLLAIQRIFGLYYQVAINDHLKNK